VGGNWRRILLTGLVLTVTLATVGAGTASAANRSRPAARASVHADPVVGGGNPAAPADTSPLHANRHAESSGSRAARQSTRQSRQTQQSSGEPAGCAARSGVPDGLYEFSGCFTQPNADEYVSTQTVSLDGLEISPLDGSSVVFTVGADHMNTTGPATVSLVIPVIGATVTIHEGELHFDLNGDVGIGVPPVSVAGFGISGVLRLDPSSGGSLTATVKAVLPAVLGEEKVTLSITSTLAGEVTAMSISSADGELARLFRLDTMSLSWAGNANGSTWTVAATAKTATRQTAAFGGSLTYASDGTLTAASLSVSGDLSLAGLIDLKNFGVAYSSGAWAGSATLAQNGQSVTIVLAFDAAGHLTAGSVQASGTMNLFGVLPLQSFALAFNLSQTGGHWAIAARTTFGNSISAALGLRDGVITGASFSLGNISFRGVLTLEHASLSYRFDPSTNVTEYQGTISVLIPGATVIQGARVHLHIANDAFRSASIDVRGNVPIYTAIFLRSLGASITVSPNFRFCGRAGVGVGPPIGNENILHVHGELCFQSSTSVPPPTYSLSASGTIRVLSKVIGSGGASLSATNGSFSSATANFSLGENGGGLSFLGGHVVLSGAVNASVTPGSISASANVSVDVNAFGVHVNGSGQFALNNNGMAACVPYSTFFGNYSAGLQWTWGSRPDFFTKNCSTAGF